MLQIPAPPLEHFRMTGYSGTPLAQKLGIAPKMAVVLISTPANYRKLLGPIAGSVKFSDKIKNTSNFVHVSTKSRDELEKSLSILRERMADTGTVWVSWPKKSAGVHTDVTEDVVRGIALPLGFVDVKGDDALVIANFRCQFEASPTSEIERKACFGATPKPKRETRVLPRHDHRDFAGRFPDEWR